MRGWNKYNKKGGKTNCSTNNDYIFNTDISTNKWFENVDGFGFDSSMQERQEKQERQERQERQNNNETKINMSNYCNNCGKYGHLFSSCLVPITSIGIIACRKKLNNKDNTDNAYSADNADNYNNSELNCLEKYGVIDCTVVSDKTTMSIKNEIEYLMIQRVDSFGYIEFMRGKYAIHNYQFLKNIIDEMTIQEKQNILTKSFDELWIALWGDYSGLQYRGEKQVSKNKYLQLKSGVNVGNMRYDLQSLITTSITQWDTAEWGFPKGRRNHQEKDIDCAFREFTEETGYSKECLKQICNVLPYEEVFIGSNLKCYKNKYFLFYMNSNECNTTGYQISEVKNMKWMTYSECVEIIRPYNIEKKNMLTSINDTLHAFYICNI
jgi:ADP-ribose pyrophosphatase YjhB (NUDIX family)